MCSQLVQKQYGKRDKCVRSNSPIKTEKTHKKCTQSGRERARERDVVYPLSSL